tara:strand:- start:460 stop:1119 length:660 start_codon:yes stop_codon:yes gene_type:complete
VSKNNPTACPICDNGEKQAFFSDIERQYYRCSCCDLIFVPREYHLSESEERARYDSHNNDPNDLRYRNFFNQLLTPLLAILPGNSYGLDFGSGPGPTLSLMLEECGHKVDLYDKFYVQNEVVFENCYDFITATEVVEHLARPLKDLNLLAGILRKGGVLAIMTEIVSPQLDFTNWYYKNDPSHVCFFSEKTFVYLANLLGLEIATLSERVIILRKDLTS